METTDNQNPINFLYKKNSNYMIRINKKEKEPKEKMKNKQTIQSNQAITLIALVITILFSYDEKLKYSNRKGFLLATI